jgi:NADPH:quinone reductase-like Zn-dependent oxidoreductase
MGTWANEVVMQEQLNRILEGIQEGRLEPIIDSVFPAEKVQEAHQYIHDAKNIGKVLLEFEASP